MSILYSCICRSKDAVVLVERCSVAVLQNADETFRDDDDPETIRSAEFTSTNSSENNISSVMVSLMEQLRDNPSIMVKDGELKTFVQKNSYYSNWNSGIPDLLHDFIESACGSNVGNDTSDTHYFHVLYKSGLYFACLSDCPEQRYQKVNYAFLHKLQETFTKEFSRRQINNASAKSGMRKQFQSQLQLHMHYYNTNMEKLAQDEKVAKLMAKVDDMKHVMGRNMAVLYERGESLADMVDRSEDMRQDTQVFQKKVKVFQKRQRSKHAHTWHFRAWAICGAFIILVYLLLAGICSWNFRRCYIATVYDGAIDNAD